MSGECPAPIQNQPAVQPVSRSTLKPTAIRGSAVKPAGSSPRAPGFGATPGILRAHPHSSACFSRARSSSARSLKSRSSSAPGPVPQVPAPPERPPDFIVFPKKMLGGSPPRVCLICLEAFLCVPVLHQPPGRPPPPDCTVTARDVPSGRGAICHMFVPV